VLDFLNFTVRQIDLGFEKSFWLPLARAATTPKLNPAQDLRRSP
jgi:hypothetical protein